jgi:hypothetical protein
MVDLVLQYSSVPTVCVDRYWLCSFIQTLNVNVKRAPNKCSEAVNTKASLEEFRGGIAHD